MIYDCLIVGGGIAPADFLRVARAELGRYGTIERRELEIVDASREGGQFHALGADGSRLVARRLLLATGVVDELPALDGLDAVLDTDGPPIPEDAAARLGAAGVAIHKSLMKADLS